MWWLWTDIWDFFASLGEWAFVLLLAAGGGYLVLFPPMAITMLRKVGIILCIIAGGYALVLLGDWRGSTRAAAECHEAELRSEIASKQRDLDAAKATAADAKKRADDLDAHASDLDMKVADYAEKLAARPACVLSGDDLRRLRNIR